MSSRLRVEYHTDVEEYLIMRGFGMNTVELCRTTSYLSATEVLTALRVSENRNRNQRYTDLYRGSINDVTGSKKYPALTRYR